MRVVGQIAPGHPGSKRKTASSALQCFHCQVQGTCTPLQLFSKSARQLRRTTSFDIKFIKFLDLPTSLRTREAARSRMPLLADHADPHSLAQLLQAVPDLDAYPLATFQSLWISTRDPGSCHHKFTSIHVAIDAAIRTLLAFGTRRLDISREIVNIASRSGHRTCMLRSAP